MNIRLLLALLEQKQKERAWWHLAAPEEDGEVLLEVSDVVRETLIETMFSKNTNADDLDADELADLAADLPQRSGV